MDIEHGSTDSPCTQQNWHVLYVRVDFERIVAAFLHRKGYESYLPIAHKRRHGTDLIQLVVSFLFPGYIFGKVDAAKKQEILMIPGVIDLGTVADPMIVEGEIWAIKRILESGLLYWPCSPRTAGELVQIEHGPLVGLQGIFVDRPQHHVIIPVTVLSRGLSVAIERGAVKPVSRAKGRSV